MSGDSPQGVAPVVALVDNLLVIAVSRLASDIHLEPTDENLRVRMRIDGILYDQEPVDHAVMDQVLSRLKVLARIDIAEKRIPQDGKFNLKLAGHIVDLRVSTFPSLYGEKIVVRILDRSSNKIMLDQLGMASDLLCQFKELLGKSSGFFLVTGPTGSGKTTTLYSALSFLNSPDRHIITLEDPVEYNLEGITQGQVKPEAGFSFEKGIRAILRQDPDILMVGEIRDKQTARIAIEAALTGHLVLSTLHTNDAPSAVMRLMDMGVEPFLVKAAVSGVLAQRLARKICGDCRVQIVPDERKRIMLRRLGLQTKNIFKGKGCNRCFGSGCKGRIGIFQLLAMSNDLRSKIGPQPSFEELQTQAKEDGMQTLVYDAMKKVKNGVIDVDELIRIVL